MKAMMILPKLAIMVVGLMLGAIVVTAVVPLVSGGLTVEPTDDSSAISMEQAPGGMLRLKGSYTIKSSLPYDINNAQISIKLGSDKSAGKLLVYDSDIFSIPKGGEYVLNIDSYLFMPLLFLFGLNINKDGQLYVPATLFVGGSYIQNMAKVAIDIDARLNLTEGGSTLTFDKTSNGSGDYLDFKVEVGGGGIPMEDGTTTVTIGDVTITTTKTGEKVTIEITTTGEGIIGDVKKAEEVKSGDHSMELTEGQAEIISATLEKLINEVGNP